MIYTYCKSVQYLICRTEDEIFINQIIKTKYYNVDEITYSIYFLM